MKKTQLIRSVTVVLLFSAIMFSSGLLFAQTADEKVELGKQEIFENRNLEESLLRFDEAIVITPTHQRAHFWKAFAGAMAMVNNPDFAAMLDEVGIRDLAGNLLFLDEDDNENYNSDANVENIIIDDDDAGYTDLLDWNDLVEPDIKDPYGGQCRYHAAGDGSNEATWTPNIITAGYYRIYAWVPSATENTTAAEYTVNHAAGSDNVVLSQFGHGWAQWMYLGMYPFNAGASQSVVLSDDTASGRVVADAIKMEYEGIIHDDSDISGFSTTGTWATVTGAPDGFLGNYRSHDAGAGDTATWTLNITEAGEYAVYARWVSFVESAEDAEYIIGFADGSLDFVTVNQNENNNRWYCLGTYDFPVGPGVNTVILDSHATGKVVADAIKIMPVRPYPDLADMSAIFRNTLPDFNDALNHLSFINSSFVDSYLFSGTSDEVDFDYAEAKALEGGFIWMKMMINLLTSYQDGGLTVHEMFCGENTTVESCLSDHPSLLNLAVPNYLLDAKSNFESMIEAYMAASDFMRNTRVDDDGLNHLIAMYPPYDPLQYPSLEAWEEEKQDALEEEETMRDFFGDIYDNLTDPGTYPYVEAMSEIELDLDKNNMRINFNEFLTDPIVIRDYIEEIIDNDMIRDTWTPSLDPTFDGVFPGMRSADWNYLFGNGQDFTGDPAIDWGGALPETEVNWEEVQPDHLAFFERYELYRSTTPVVNRFASTLVATITNPATTSVTDDTIDGQIDRYYYRLYTFYDFVGEGGVAEAYSEVGETVLGIYVDAGYSGEEEGTREKPATDLGDAIREYASNGTRFLVAVGTYYENAQTLNIWSADDSLILEGGYESAGWTRDVGVNETIIDANGADESVIGIWNFEDFTIDGFTITGSSGNNHNGISMWNAGNVVIRNCKIINNGFAGISIDQVSNITVEHCTIADNPDRGIVIGGPTTIDRNVSIFNNLILNNGWDGIGYFGQTMNDTVSIVNNTIAGNGSSGGIYLADFDATGASTCEVKNNIIFANNGGTSIGIDCNNTDPTTVSTVVSYNNSYGHTFSNYWDCGTIDGSNISQDPLFATGPNHAYYLSQTAAGQASSSPSVDTGSDTAANLGLDTDFSTRTDQIPDSGQVDMGYHATAAETIALITDVLPSNYETAYDLGVGDEPYIDRSQTITDMPAELENATWIKTAANDKDETAEDFLTFALTKDSVVYVAYSIGATLPDWMDGFFDTGLKIKKSAGGNLQVHAKYFAAGDITLGANHALGYAGAITNYVVLAQDVSSHSLIRHVNPLKYEVVEDLGVGDTPYIDRSQTITDMPAELANATWIKTANNDVNETAEDFLNFILTQDAVVYVAYSKAATSLPDWMAEFIDTGYIIKKSAGGNLRVYAKFFAAGKASLGANHALGYAGAITNYVVLAQDVSSYSLIRHVNPLKYEVTEDLGVGDEPYIDRSQT
ncbi:MAG: right-handed parallel beta-helix repeat-containing protein, partial [Candidatus Omnitrophica bacterium]|nr:right-handed parallel beta-helix repeat-containing protein [Candidatus Omnitrophota bacterium]